jgi:putative ABC transport system permease protein
MEKPREWWLRVSSLWRGAEQESGLEDEIRFHIERQTEKNLRHGMSPEEARRAAVVRFGGVERMKESVRDEVRPVPLDDLSRDLRYGVRTLLRAPSFAVVSILTLGVGIGAATAIFTVVEGVLLRPLPYPEPDRIVRLFQVGEAGNRFGVSDPNFEDWKTQSRSFQAMAEMAGPFPMSVMGGLEPNRARVARVSREFFDVMGVKPVMGRGFFEEEQKQGAAPAVIVSNAYWREWLGSNPNLTEQTLNFNQRAHNVVGVMPLGFDYPGGTQIWYARELDEVSVSRTAHNHQVVARLAPGRPLHAAHAELSAISRALKERYGDDTWMFDAAVVSLHEVMTSSVRPALLALIGAAGFLLLIACANVSNLLLARAASRRRELALRLALGAGRWRVARQLMAESLVLCLSGGALGVWIAFLGVKALLALEPGSLPRLGEVSMSGRVLAFAIAVSVVTALALGLATTLRANERELRGWLTDGQRTMAGGKASQRVRHALVVVQVALTLVLLTGAALLGRSFLRLLSVDTGYRTEGGIVLDLSLPPVEGEASGRQQARFQEELMARLSNLPGVQEVGGINDFPLGGTFYPNGNFLEMTSADEIRSYEDMRKLADVQERTGFAGYRVASEGYFRAMGIPLVRGRLFDAGDGPDAPHVALISESLVQTRWPDRDPLGRFIQFGNMDGDIRAFRIVGVVGDVREHGPEALPAPLLYGDYRQRMAAASRFSIVVVTDSRTADLAPTVQRIVRELDPQLPVQIRTLEDAFSNTFAGRRFSLLLSGVFGATALMLATLGIYGVMSYLVAQRTREIGIRMALGAAGRDVLGTIIGQGARLSLIGTAIGLAGALALTRVVERLLFGIEATDPVAFAGVVILIAASTALASYIPARRAMRVPPLISLRAE